jgi:hypothetical protein
MRLAASVLIATTVLLGTVLAANRLACPPSPPALDDAATALDGACAMVATDLGGVVGLVLGMGCGVLVWWWPRRASRASGQPS